MTREEAKEKLCPIIKAMNGAPYSCKTDDCMMWREEHVDSEGRPLAVSLGWCGLAGRAGAL